MSSPDYDVIVVGGGMVGAALAALLAKRRLHVALLEAREPPQFDPDSEPGLRVSAISPVSERLLAHLGAWSAVTAARNGAGAGRYGAMHVWDEGTPADSNAALQFDCEQIGEPYLGHIVENQLIQWALFNQLAHDNQVAIFAPAQLEALEVTARAVNVRLDDQRRLTARLIVGADGAASRTRELCGIETSGWPYDQQAVVTHVVTEQPHSQTARQRFLAAGPLALLPLADGRSSVVWSTAPEHAKSLLAMDAEQFNEALCVASDHVLGRIVKCSERASFPLRLLHAKRYSLNRVALVGDAAHAIHPLAGQGVNLGLLDAAVLDEVIGDGLEQGQDIGDPVVLRRYERWRKGHNVAMMGALDIFKRVFGADNEALRRLRQFGLGWVNASAPVKSRFMRAAMGSAGDLPRVLRTP